jgi:hypothetical protein
MRILSSTAIFVCVFMLFHPHAIAQCECPGSQWEWITKCNCGDPSYDCCNVIYQGTLEFWESDFEVDCYDKFGLYKGQTYFVEVTNVCVGPLMACMQNPNCEPCTYKKRCIVIKPLYDIPPGYGCPSGSAPVWPVGGGFVYDTCT